MDDFNFLHGQYDQANHLKQDNLLMSSRPSIVLVEDDKVLGLGIKKFLQKTLGVEVKYFSSGSDCLKDLQQTSLEQSFCFITDISLEQGTDGLLLIDILREKGFRFVPIVMTGFASVETAISATKKGVFHYLTKPFELEHLHDLIVQAFGQKMGIDISNSLQGENGSASVRSDNEDNLSSTLSKSGKFKIERPSNNDIFCGMIGRSTAMRDIFSQIRRVAESDSTVLVTGPSGTGKELVANAIHQLSQRRKHNLVSVNCGAIPSELLESELFGHIKGAFTGAISNRVGRFELAHKGTVFLDEIGDMPLLLQVKLLRVLQGRQIEPVGGMRPVDVDIRVIAATHRDLEKAIVDGKFREDLFYRLNVIPIKIPPLKERRDDIPLLISYFLSRFVSADGSNKIDFSDETLELMMSYDWPGNVRELENVIERLVILRGGNVIEPEDLPAKIFRNNPLATSLYKTIFELPQDGLDIKTVLSDIEDSLILQALSRTKGNKNRASRLLHMNRTTLIEKMKKKGILSP